MLTGKYAVDKRPKKGRLVESEIYGTRYHHEAMYKIARDFTDLAER